MNRNSDDILGSGKDFRLDEREKAKSKEFIMDYIGRHPVRNTSDNRLNISKMDTNTFFATAKKVCLSAREKVTVKDRITNTAATHEPLLYGNNFISNIGSFFRRMFVFHRFLSALVIVLMLITGAGGTVSYAAENALPGDTLYPVKVNINERIRAGFTFGDKNKADFCLQRAERRLNELGRLINRDLPPPDFHKQALGHFENHVKELEEKIEALRNAGEEEAADELQNHLTSSLTAHERMFEKIKEEKCPRCNGRFGEIIENLDRTKGDFQKRFAGKTPPPEHMEKMIPQQITETKKWLNKVKITVDSLNLSNDSQRLSQRLAMAAMFIGQAEGLIKEEDYPRARHLVHETRRVLHEVETEIEMKKIIQ